MEQKSIEEQTLDVTRAEKSPFIYIDSSIISQELLSMLGDDEQYEGCDCSKSCSIDNCPCIQRFGLNYDSESRCLLSNKSTTPIFECNSECQCNVDECSNRLTQQEQSYKYEQLMEIFHTPDKGYGVRCRQTLPYSGTFIGLYLGEVLTEQEAKQRSSSSVYEHNYLLLFNEHNLQGNKAKEVKTFTDARYYGNWTRFLNHSCEPKLQVVPVRVDNSCPRIAFFTNQPISAGEELTYSYGTHAHSDFPVSKMKKCFCSSSQCKGYMPYQLFD